MSVPINAVPELSNASAGHREKTSEGKSTCRWSLQEPMRSHRTRTLLDRDRCCRSHCRCCSSVGSWLNTTLRPDSRSATLTLSWLSLIGGVSFRELLERRISGLYCSRRSQARGRPPLLGSRAGLRCPATLFGKQLSAVTILQYAQFLRSATV